MNQFAHSYIRRVGGLNRIIGRIVMYGIFVMMAILLWSSISKTFFVPSLWTLEMAQFAMVAYCILGGPYSIQPGTNVRMAPIYGEWSPRRKAWTDIFTVLFLFLIFYLVVLLWGDRGGFDLGFSAAMNGLSVAGMAIVATIALPELLKRGYDKRMVAGVIQAGSSLGLLVPLSVVLVLYAMIARQPVGQLWLAGVVPGLMMAGMFVLYVAIRCKLNPALGPALPEDERNVGCAEKMRLLRTSLVESSAIGAMAAFLAAVFKGRMKREVFENSVRGTLGISMWILLAALAFGAVFDGLGAAKAIESVFTEKLGLSPWMILMQLSFILMGTFLGDTAMLVIVAPPYVPLVGALGFDLIWYGVLYAIITQIAYMAPPFGYFPFASRHSLDVPVLFNQYGLAEIRDAEYSKLGVKHISAGARAPCHFANMDRWNELPDDLQTLFRVCCDQSHYHRQWWYWGGRSQPAGQWAKDGADPDPRQRMGHGRGRGTGVLGRNRSRIRNQGQGQGCRDLQEVQRHHGKGRQALPLRLTIGRSHAPA